MLVAKSEPVAEGTVIMAEHQYAGRGQQGNTWVAEAGKNLTCSLLLKPSFLKPADQFQLNMMVSVALKDALREITGEAIELKWPNDLYYKGAKLGGILIENSIGGQTYKHCIIGMGLNVNQQVFPNTLQRSITSLSQILQKDVNLNALLPVICSHIEKHYLKLRAGKHPTLKNDYLQSLYRMGALSRYCADGQEFEGKIKGVDDIGRLIVDIDGISKAYGFKEIQFLDDV